MGLDSVELVMAFEEEFAIKISDEEAAQIITIGDATGLVRDKIVKNSAIPPNQEGENLSEIEFDLKQRFESKIDQYFQEVPHLTDQTPLEVLFSISNRREQWRDFSDHLGGRIPELKRPFLVSAVIVATAGFPTIYFALVHSGWALLGFLPILFFLFRITRPIKICFPGDLRFYGDLKPNLWKYAPRNALERIKRAGFTHDAVRLEVVAITVEQIGVDPEQCTENARFIQDLGMD